jgi:amino acid adenylation domain-containing protein/thioester reductase-like protein
MRLHELIERQAAATPDAVALVGVDGALTYAELDDWANRLAHRLHRAGVRPERPTAVVAERRAETVVAILAVLKAGGAYVPIDPAVPPNRFSYLMADSGAGILVGGAGRAATLPAGDWTVVPLDRAGLGAEPAGPPAVRVDPGNAAYVIYTSGSTGQPKGVVVSHRQIVASTMAHQGYGRPVPTNFLLLISFSFDACACGLYWTLSTGGRVTVPTDEQVHDPLALRALIERHEVSHTDSTPALYSLILGSDPAPLRSLRCAIVGGEACPADLVTRHARLLPDTVLVNNYGPTETTVLATTTDLGPETVGESVPIGRVIPGTRAYVLDDAGADVEDGRIGELNLGGDLVARGYHRRPGLTADRFRPDPRAEVPGGRVYQTGDRVRVRADGQFEFCGRSDHQVKVRGFRVELGEVEKALTTHPAVVEAVADVRTLGVAAALVAWVRLADGAASAEDVRAHVARWLPDHMVPARVVVLDALPRNVAGKVDRVALPTPTGAPGTGSPGIDDRPMTALEAEVAEMVATVLGLDRISTDTNFFVAGASSLHVTQLAMALWGRYGEVRLQELFQRPTVAGIARVIDATRERRLADGLEPWDLERLAAEAVLDPAIRADRLPAGRWFQPRAVLVTGATGYLGAFLVHELAARTDATIWCLVRARDEEHGLRRLRETMQQYLIWDERLVDRLRVVVGDLALPRLGLSEPRYEELSRTVDVIHHSGALVNFIYPYEELKPPNVDGTAEILRLASTHTLKAVHFISTIDNFLQTDIPRPYLEDMELEPLDVPSGYPRSKWVAEHLVRIARNRGIPCSIYRPGMMISHTETGATQTVDFLLIQIKGLMEFGVIPEADFIFDAVPIDYAAQAIAHISLRREVLGRNFHLWNLEPVHVREVHEWIRSFGYAFETVPLEVAVQHLVTLDASNPMFRMLPLMMDEYAGRPPEAFEPGVGDVADFAAECRNTLAALSDSDIVCPKMTKELAHKCFQYLVDIGFYPTPAEQRAKLGVAAATARSG